MPVTSSDPWIDTEDLADEEAKASSDTSDCLESIWHCSHTVDVGVEDTQDVLEVVNVLQDKSHLIYMVI